MSEPEEVFRLTERGEMEAVKLLGGQDITNVAAFLNLVHERQGWKADIGTWLAMTTAAKVFRETVPTLWPNIVRKFEAALAKEKPDYFSHTPKAFPSPPYPDAA